MKQGNKSIGHPVDIATGTVYSNYDDICIPGKVDLTWERRYSTAILEQNNAHMGPGWANKYFSTLTRLEKEYQFLTPEGEIEIFSDPNNSVENGHVIRNLETFQELYKKDYRYIITRCDVDTGDILRYSFYEMDIGQTAKLKSIEDVTGYQGLDLYYDKKHVKLEYIKQRLEKRSLRIEYTKKKQIQKIIFCSANDQEYVMAQFEYDNKKRLTAAYDAQGNVDRYEYDNAHRMTREIVKDGGVFFFKYDRQGRCIKTSGLDRYDEKTFKYFDYGWTEVTDSLGEISRYQYLPSGQIIMEIDPMGGVTKTEYDEYGRIIKEIEANGAETLYEFDNKGNISKYTDALSNSTLISYNNFHQPLQVVDSKNNLSKYIYNNNLLVNYIDPNEAIWSYEYNSLGLLISITNPHKKMRYLNYSDLGVLRSSSDWIGNTAHYKWDDFGNLREQRNSNNEITQIDYSILGQPLKIIFPDKSEITYKYDKGGNRALIIDRAGLVKQYTYGPCERLLEEQIGDHHSIQYKWGTEPGELQSIINQAGERYDFIYNSSGKIIKEKSFDNRITLYEYTIGGQISSITNQRGELIEYEYDNNGRLIKKTLPDNNTVTYEYDSRGNISLLENHVCSISFEHDYFGRVTKETQFINELNKKFEIERTYDDVDTLVSLKSNLDLEIDYKYDPNGFLTEMITNHSDKFKFINNINGQETSRYLPGNYEFRNTYNKMGNINAQSVNNSNSELIGKFTQHELNEPIIQRIYQYNRNSSIISCVDKLSGKTEYEYNALDQLLKVRKNGKTTHAYNYDLKGNISEISTNQQTIENLLYDSGSVIKQKGKTLYAHDNNGCLVEESIERDNQTVPVSQYTWDSENQLKTYKNNNNEIWYYEYDPLGRRIIKKNNKTTCYYIWNNNVILHQVENEDLHSTWLYHTNNNDPIGTYQNDTIYSIITDAVGKPTEIIDKNGTLVWSCLYNAWGEASISTNSSIECNLRFPGQWFDKENGLHYNRFRYYHPDTGRFISPDPIGLYNDLNEYLYAPNPINWEDFFGLAFSSGKPPHTADVTIYDNNNRDLKYVGTISSGNMTNEERALGFPKASLATHTENRAARRPEFGPGDTMVIEGKYPPCSSCKGAMNRAVNNNPGSRIIYTWEGQSWEAGKEAAKARRRVADRKRRARKRKQRQNKKKC